MIAFELMPEEQQHPAADKTGTAPDPFREEEQNDPRKNHRDTNSVQKLVPPGSVFVIVLRHVVRQIWNSAPPCDGNVTCRSLTVYRKN